MPTIACHHRLLYHRDGFQVANMSPDTVTVWIPEFKMTKSLRSGRRYAFCKCNFNIPGMDVNLRLLNQEENYMIRITSGYEVSEELERESVSFIVQPNGTTKADLEMLPNSVMKLRSVTCDLLDPVFVVLWDSTIVRNNDLELCQGEERCARAEAFKTYTEIQL
jgi:hypothetical protein